MTDSGMASDALAIARLAALPGIEYDRCRESEASRLGIRVATLDAEVAAARRAVGRHDEDEADRPPEYSDESIALKFTERHAGQLRYVSAWGRWLRYDGARWAPDETLAVFDLARGICRTAAAECNDQRTAPRIAAAQTVTAVERLARADRRHAATADQWDADPWLLNTPGGVVDLRTGNARPHAPTDHMTKITAAAPGGDCPLWRRFLDRITGGDADLCAFLQRMAGYSLTGITREHAMVFCYGTGSNGKGVFLNTLTAIWGDYAATATMETFTASPTDRHPTDLAMLRGARLVTAQETEEGRRWAEARIKAMTGGDPITARFMRQDFFTFVPTFKLLIAGNHKPALRGVDEAIRRRLHLIPFGVTIPAAERDKELPGKLKAEWGGILAWAIEGCLDWQRDGLTPPPAVASATDEYLAGEDSLGLWVTECCTTSGYGNEAGARLFSSWRTWAEAAGEQAGSQRRFTQALLARGFEQTRLHGGTRGFQGIYLRAEQPFGEGR